MKNDCSQAIPRSVVRSLHKFTSLSWFMSAESAILDCFYSLQSITKNPFVSLDVSPRPPPHRTLHPRLVVGNNRKQVDRLFALSLCLTSLFSARRYTTEVKKEKNLASCGSSNSMERGFFICICFISIAFDISPGAQNERNSKVYCKQEGECR